MLTVSEYGISIRPKAGTYKPLIKRSKVLFPLPFDPVTAVIRPFGNENRASVKMFVESPNPKFKSVICKTVPVWSR